jgi:hypothetical protein
VTNRATKTITTVWLIVLEVENEIEALSMVRSDKHTVDGKLYGRGAIICEVLQAYISQLFSNKELCCS